MNDKQYPIAITKVKKEGNVRTLEVPTTIYKIGN